MFNRLIRFTRTWAGRSAELFVAVCLIFTAMLILYSLAMEYRR